MCLLYKIQYKFNYLHNLLDLASFHVDHFFCIINSDIISVLLVYHISNIKDYIRYQISRNIYHVKYQGLYNMSNASMSTFN